MREVLETVKQVAKRSSQVQIDRQALKFFCQKLLEEGMETPSWDQFYHFHGSGEETVSYLLVLDSINFCFWPPPGEPTWEIAYLSSRLSGYYGLAASLKQAVESGTPLTKAEFLSALSLEELKDILGGRGALQLLRQRVQNLNELGRFLLEAYGGEAYRLVDAAQNSAVRLVQLLAEGLSSFRDTAHYQGCKIFFYKRAQLFAADLYGAFRGEDWGRFKDIEELTAFADYKLPQVLRHLGIFQYTSDLARNVDQEIYLEPGSTAEVEIRANTIWAVELIRQELSRAGKDVRAFEIDWALWNLGQHAEYRTKPYHRTATIFY
jgi:hypothetical protein